MTVVGSKNDEATKQAPQEPIKSETTAETDGPFDDVDADTPIDTESTNAKNAERVSKIPGNAREKLVEKTEINGEKFTQEELTITADDKAAFLDSVVTGERYLRAYDIFGGKVHVVIRNRTTEETQAMYAYLRHELARKDSNVPLLEGDMSYVLLVTQVEEINGTKYPAMKGPMFYTYDKGVEVPPAWLEDLKAWKSRHEALTNAIIHQIQLFEYKYWIMINESASKNFWNSDTSTAD